MADYPVQPGSTDDRPGAVYRSGGAFASSIAAVAQFRIERRRIAGVATSHCALPNLPAAFWQQGPVLMRVSADFYNFYPWGASFCTPRMLGWRGARSPSSGEPGHPLLRDDPDHIRQVAAPFATALLDGEKSEPSR